MSGEQKTEDDRVCPVCTAHPMETGESECAVCRGDKVYRSNHILRLGHLEFQVDFQGEIEISRECEEAGDHFEWLDRAKAQELAEFLRCYLSGVCMKCLGRGAKAPNGVEYCNCE